MNEDPLHLLAIRRLTATGFLLLAFSLPLGLTLEALHALKAASYLDHALRRELWTLAHAHGNLLGMLCLVVAALGNRVASSGAAHRRFAGLLVSGSVAMPLGFLLGGIGNRAGDPSLGILLVPLGGLLLLVALWQGALAVLRSGAGAAP